MKSIIRSKMPRPILKSRSSCNRNTNISRKKDCSQESTTLIHFLFSAHVVCSVGGLWGWCKRTKIFYDQAQADKWTSCARSLFLNQRGGQLDWTQGLVKRRARGFSQANLFLSFSPPRTRRPVPYRKPSSLSFWFKEYRLHMLLSCTTLTQFPDNILTFFRYAPSISKAKSHRLLWAVPQTIITFLQTEA